MILAWKIILIVIILISFMGAIADEDKLTKTSCAAICVAAILSMTATLILL